MLATPGACFHHCIFAAALPAPGLPTHPDPGSAPAVLLLPTQVRVLVRAEGPTRVLTVMDTVRHLLANEIQPLPPAPFGRLARLWPQQHRGGSGSGSGGERAGTGGDRQEALLAAAAAAAIAPPPGRVVPSGGRSYLVSLH